MNTWMSFQGRLALNVTIAAVAIVSLLPTTSFATTYAVPYDYAVVCLDERTGAVLWKARPSTLPSPYFSAIGPFLWIEPLFPYSLRDVRPARLLLTGSGREVPAWLVISLPLIAVGAVLWRKRRRRLALLVALVATVPVSAPVASMGARIATAITSRSLDFPALLPGRGPIAELRRNLATPGGLRLSYREGDTRHLQEAWTGRVVRELEDFPQDLHVVGNLAVFTFAGGTSSMDLGGGEVYAYDLDREELAWEFDASRLIGAISENAYTALAVDGSVVYVAVEQVVFALDASSGAPIWHTRLPRQQIRPFDSPWTRFGRRDDKLIVACYEQLCLLDPKNGEMLWCFPVGQLGVPWPAASGDRLFVAVRDDPVQIMSTSLVPGLPTRRMSAIKVERTPGPGGDDYQVAFLSRREIPEGARVFWSLARPAPASGKGEVVKLRLEGFEYEPLTLDLTQPLRETNEAYVKTAWWVDRAVLVGDGKTVLVVDKPSSE